MGTAAIEQERQKELELHRQKVDVDSYDITVRELVRMCADGELNIAPEYQRKFRWSETDESRLIESLLLGLPVPSLYVATNDNGTWEMVDGLQRMSTALHFIADPPEVLQKIGKERPLTLQGLEKLESFNDLSFEQLPAASKLAFPRRTFRVTALSDKSDYNVRFDLFERLNRGGIALSPQEVRACIFRGDFDEFLEDLARDPNFQALIKLQRGHENDGTREELILKYFAYRHARENFTGKVTDFLNDFMKDVNRDRPLDYDKERQLFKAVCQALIETIRGHIQRAGYGLTPLNQAEAILVAAAELIDRGVTKFTPPSNWLNDEQLVRFSTKGTNTRNFLRGRISRAIELLGGKAPKEFGIDDLE